MISLSHIKNVDANLTEFPTYSPSTLGLSDDVTRKQELTLGDLSGNTLLLLWTLLTAGIVEIDENNYRNFIELCAEINKNNANAVEPSETGIPGKGILNIKKLIPLTIEQANTFDVVLAAIRLKNSNILLRLLGDELADRFDSDVLMIGLLYRLSVLAAPFKILASNHLHFFVENFLSTGSEDPAILAGGQGQGISLLHLQASITAGTVQNEKIRQQVHAIYTTRLPLLDASIEDEKSMTLYAHAPFDLVGVEKAATALHIEMKEEYETTAEVALLIDEINEKFNAIYVIPYFSGSSDIPKLSEDAENFGYAGNPLGGLIQQKDFTKIKNPTPSRFRKISFTLVHGHMDEEALVHGHIDSMEKNTNTVLSPRFNLNSSVQQSPKQWKFPVASRNDSATPTLRSNSSSPVTPTNQPYVLNNSLRSIAIMSSPPTTPTTTIRSASPRG